MADQLRTLIGRVRQRWFAQVALGHGGRAAACAAVPILAATLAEWLLAPGGTALVVLAAAAALLAVGIAAAELARMQRRPADRQVARFIEERAAAIPGVGPLDDALVSAVDVASAPPESPQAGFVPLIVSSAVARLRGLSPGDIVPPGVIRRAALQAAGGALALAVALTVAAPGGMRAFDTARVRFFPGWISVEVAPGHVRVPAGSPVRIRAVVRGGGATLDRFPPELTVSAGGEQRTVRMAPGDGAFEFAFESVDRTFAYRVTAGAAASDEYTVTALVPPRVRQVDVRYVYPAFTKLAPREEEDGGDIYAPAGTRVRLRIHADRPVIAGALAMGRAGQPLTTLRAAGERLLEAELVLTHDDSYRVTLRDADGLASDGGSEYFIRLMDDRPPDVRIVRPSADQSITPLEEVAIEARADDDYGISRLELVYSVAGGPERVVPFTSLTGTDVQRIGSRLLAAEDLDVKPGDVIAYYARAWDVGRGKRPTRAQSDLFFLEVKPFGEEFVAAQSQAGAGSGAGARIEALISAQKEIISATWNLERRSGGGMSAGDLERVAAAQAELRQRVEQLASRSNRRPRAGRPPERLAGQLPGQGPRASAGDPLASALEAMTRAIQQLEAQKTKDAIPHEMAALNGLLEAQAEVRRREVSRQSRSGGSGGSSRSDQDLSALFDRELQRQQRTNYENRSRIEERPDRNETAQSSAADKIRDLARRQEELNRKERDLAGSGLSPEEMKRQLERLTREQQELRERAEDVARQVGQQAGSRPQGQQAERGQQQGQRGGQQGQAAGASRAGEGQPSGGGSSGMREASEQMRSAAGELRRQDPNAAAARGEKAAERLRRLEQEMRAGTQGTAGDRAGEVRLEAQQIAQEQRRIAAEAERLESAQGSAAAEARRRLAGEKERLARRVDDLQRAAAEQAKRDAAGGMGEAAKELERQQLGQRMRDSAGAMRDGASGTPPERGRAEDERQLASALDRIVEKLGGDSAEAAGLSDRLEETREMRERLNRLEQQVREAEARQEAGRPGKPGQQGRAGQQGSRGSSGGGDGAGELARLREEYQRELQRAREALGRLSRGEPRDGLGASTPEEHEFSRSAPGTEAFKQDRSGWESLRRDVDLAMERYEAAVSDRLARTLAEARLSAGGSDRVPERYRRQVAQYYESLARVKK